MAVSYWAIIVPMGMPSQLNDTQVLFKIQDMAVEGDEETAVCLGMFYAV